MMIRLWRRTATERCRLTASTTSCFRWRQRTRSRCIVCPLTPARRSRPRCFMDRVSGSGSRPRTADMPRKRCSTTWSTSSSRARAPPATDHLGSLGYDSRRMQTMAASKPSSSSGRSRSRKTSARRSSGARKQIAGVGDGLTSVVEELINKILRPRDAVMITRDRIQQTLDEAAERGRLTRSDANEVVIELLRRGHQQTDELLSDFERLIGRGRTGVDSARRRAWQSEPVDQLVRAADRARQPVSAGTSFPISAYDEMTASQVNKRLSALSRPELRTVRDYEARHANRKSVLEAIDRALR